MLAKKLLAIDKILSSKYVSWALYVKFLIEKFCLMKNFASFETSAINI